jgi:hypothetical protein
MGTRSSALVAGQQTVLDRLVGAGITEERAIGHIRNRAVLVDGHVVTDPGSPGELPARVELRFVRRSDASDN